MSAHSCNNLCEMDRRFHDIQKYEGPYEAWYADADKMREFLAKRIAETAALIDLLAEKK